MELVECKFLIFPKLSKKYWYFLLFLLGSFFRLLFTDILIKNKNPEFYKKDKLDLNVLLTQNYFLMIRNILSDLLIGFFHCFHKLRTKGEKISIKKEEYNSQNIYYIFNDKASRTLMLYKMIFVISLVDIICQLLIPLKLIIENKFFEKCENIEPTNLFFLLIFDIFARYIFSRLILETYFYKHHHLSILLNIIGLIPITIVDIMVKLKLDKHYILLIIFVAIQLILYSFEDIMNNAAFRRLYIMPNSLIFYKGLCQLVYLAIISSLFFGFKLYNFKNGFDFVFEIQLCLFFIPFNVLRTIYLVKVIDKFSAQHMTFLKVSEYFIFFVYYKIASIINLKSNYKLEIWQYIVQIFGFLLLLIASLLHNELIIINHPKLKSKTEYFLNKDANNEQYSSLYSNAFFVDYKDTSGNTCNLCDDLTDSDES